VHLGWSQAVVEVGQSDRSTVKVGQMNPVKIVEDFWAMVRKAPQDVDAIDRSVVTIRHYHGRRRHCYKGRLQRVGEAVFGVAGPLTGFWSEFSLRIAIRTGPSTWA
jgi:hypothetical protein